MKLLSLSTAEQGCSLAMVHGPSLLCEEFWTTKLTHSSRLLKMIEYMLENRAGAKLNDIDGFVVAGGPGSFTGLRIGISVVKGLSYAMNKPVASVSSLDGIAFRFACSSIPVCAMMDAKRNEVYCSVYHFNNGNLISRTPEIVVNPKEAVNMTKGESALFAGSGSKAYKELIEKEANKPIFTQGFSDNISAAALVQSLYLKDNYFSVSEDALVPRYIRKSDAELMIKNL
ncbi:MAG: tRNA (adenosine(37)-N6)-threonylcarbamoyltransferase complex dimerization subunit type 1 TsaB [Desulfobacterales bacterium RIFOXYA12_FULL_46_15]|nr:MAG: tRNA (adenosine(37)-N6)-threonylcarbamoyltransferase complex dimerization subunit type 1 TsaB [Desulfobacula sp. GWF2_41_7]OGR26928.1 MAG: tRNA (adenosine(37)-N6)-threonylcarbamoyltransferase complex dimerization subunit type 1 TsaB [Desulfobacterales bacterium RIFOXYA12_FULL_46_15]